MAARGEGETGQGIFEMGIHAELGDEEVGVEAGDQGGHDPAEGPEVGVVGRVGGQGNVDAVAGARATAAFVDEAGAGEEGAAVLVEGDGEHAVVVVEGVLYPVAVVDVDVDVGNAQPLLQQPVDGYGRVVEDAEAGGEVGAAVMQTAAVAEGDVAVAADQELGGLQSAAHFQPFGVDHAGKDGIVAGAEIVSGGGHAGLAGAEGAHGVDVVSGMEEGQLVVGGRPGRDDAHVGPVEGADFFQQFVRAL